MGGLFSEYFLQEGIRETQDWKRLTDDELKKIYSEAKRIFEDFQQRENPDEADTEDGLIIPMLDLLGFHWTRQKSPSTKGRAQVPDFVLFPDEESKKQFDRKGRGSKPWDKAVAILEAKRWRRPLDRGDRTDPIDPHIPSNQILRYLSQVEVASGGKVVWGILTNGELWRLYYNRAPSRSDSFVQFNLTQIFSQDDLEEFKRFYLLLRKDAFVPTHWRPRETFLEVALREAKRWEERITEDLKERVFEEIFLDIARGFLEDARRKGREVDDTLLEDIYHNTLVLLYRLLFLFHAEDRDLLPIRNDAYRPFSISNLRDEAARMMDSGKILSTKATFTWKKLKELFRIVNEGDRTLGVPPYNGGLFDPRKHPFLETYEVPDSYLIPAIDKLSRDYSKTPPRRINYKDLSVRQLGSIYEGLLEFKLRVAETHLGVRKQKGKEVYFPVKDESKAKVRKGELYLTNDRSERKSTGSYYTPDYIVQYIVRNTIEPLIQQKLRAFEEWKEEIGRIRSRSQLLHLMKIHGIQFDPKEYDREGRPVRDRSMDELRTALLQAKDPAQAILELKILDPAMGSGHFLVDAVDYISDRVLEILAEISGEPFFGVPYTSPLTRKLEGIRDRILTKAEEEGYFIDRAKLEDKNLIKRIILKRSIYGVDINPLAVELSKVSLWLHTFTVGAPLSFLDHHLKVGNSLIGMDPETFQRVIDEGMFGQKAAGILKALDPIQRLQELTDADISEVEESTRLYNQILQEMEPYKRVLDLFTAEFFHDPKAAFAFFEWRQGKSNRKKAPPIPWAWKELENFNPFEVIEGRREIAGKVQEMTPEEKELLQKLFQIARQKKFFHWKLEFPEVWYDKNGPKPDAGFDAIIGNPPYIRIQEIRKSDPDSAEFWKHMFQSAQKSYDIYSLFIERGLQLLAKTGILGYIVPNKFTKLEYGEPLRRLIGKHLMKFIDFGDNQIFPDQTTYTGLLFLSGSPTERALVARIPTMPVEELEKLLSSGQVDFYEIDTDRLGPEPWILVSKAEFQILEKMEERSRKLEELVERIIVGIQTSADDVYILEKVSSTGGHFRVFSRASGRELVLEKDLLKPLVSGEDIERYYVKLSRKLLLFPYRLLPEGGAQLIPEDELRELYPRTWAYLKEHEEKLRGREGGKFDDDQWYRLGRTQNLDKHERPKFGVAETVKRLEMFFDYEGRYYFHNVRVNGILMKSESQLNPYYLLALLNSRPMDFYFKQISVPHRGGHYAANKQFLSPLPIPRIDFSTRDRDLLEELERMHSEGKSNEEIMRIVRGLPSDSAVLHDFLSHLARHMSRITRRRYLLQLFVDGGLEDGTEEMLEVVETLSGHPRWKDGAPLDYRKQLAKILIESLTQDIERTDRLIDRIVYHLYGLSEKEVEIIESAPGAVSEED